MADICTTCLSRDTTLSPIGHDQLQILNKLCYPKTLVLNNRIVKLCSLCNVNLQDVNTFRTKALRSLDCLNEIWNNVQKNPMLETSTNTIPVQKNIEENSLGNIKIESTREVLDEVEIDIKCEDGQERDVLGNVKAEGMDSEPDVSSNNDPGNFLQIEVVAGKGSISIDGTQNRRKRNADIKEKRKTKCKKLWHTEILDESEMLAVMEQNRQKPSFLEAKVKCHSCAIVLPNKSMLTVHNNTFHNEAIGSFVCTICQSRYSEKRKLTGHRTLHVTTAYVCVCGYKSYCKREIVAHRCTNNSKKKSSEARVHGCKYCGKTFKSRGNIFQHVQLKHRELPRVQCDVCKRTLKNIFSLRQHMKIQHSDGLKPATSADNYCKLCDIWFNSKWTYRMHVKMSGSHADNKDKFKYQCDQCEHKFFYARLLEAHKRIVHLKQKPFKCEQCDQSFSTKRRMTAHIDTKHLNKVVEKKHICEICGAAFASGTTLRNHMYIHSTERPFKCPQCGDTFKQTAALYNHNKMVHQGYKREKLS